MKLSNLLLFVCCCSISLKNFAQTPNAIEKDLLKSLRKVNYWAIHKYDEKVEGEDSLASANNKLSKQLLYYTSKKSSTINQKFPLLKSSKLNIKTSSDGFLRIYSWDTETGGTMHFFDNVFQYKSANCTKSFAVVDMREEGDTGVSYDSVYTFKSSNKTYYLCVFMFIESTKYYGKGINVFSIENGKIRSIKLFKTDSGLNDKLSLEYELSSIVNWKTMPKINFNRESKTINIPYVDSKGTLTHRYIHYKFTGKYFEKAKS